jgi:hypothetical protein
MFNYKKEKTMASHIESGMSTYVAHFHLLIDVLKSFGEKYRPSNERLAVPELEGVLGNARESIEEVDRLVSDYIVAVFGASSPQFKEVNHITFKTKKV